MIIKGGAAGNVTFWTRHLMRDDTNDEVRLIDITGLMATNLATALREMQALARQSRSRGNFMYQANINPQANEILTESQVMEAVERLERNLRLSGHQRVIVEHVKHGRRHWHAIWNRVNSETLKVTDIKGNYVVHASTSRELEQAFGLKPTPSPDGKTRSREKLWERRAEEESGITREQVSADLLRCWNEINTGRQFRDAIGQAGYVLARGNRRDFCVVDQSGRVHSLARRLDNISTADIRERFADIDPAALPSVAEARVQQRAMNPAWRKRTSRQSAVGKAALGAAKRECFNRRRRRVVMSPATSVIKPMAASFRVAQSITQPIRSIGITRTPAKLQTTGSEFRRAFDVMTRHILLRTTTASGSSSVSTTSLPSGAARMDAAVYGRAGAAYEAEMAKWQPLIDAAASDPSLNPEQRAAAVVALRSRQHLEATAVRRRIIQEEKQRARAARRTLARPSGKPTKPAS